MSSGRARATLSSCDGRTRRRACRTAAQRLSVGTERSSLPLNMATPIALWAHFGPPPTPEGAVQAGHHNDRTAGSHLDDASARSLTTAVNRAAVGHVVASTHGL